MTYELVSVLGYTPNYVANCQEGIVFESHQVDGITSDPRYLPYYWIYTSNPGIFGMVNSFKGGDQITVRSYNYSNIGVGLIAQEDQCAGQTVIHIQGEKISFFAAGTVDFKNSIQPSNPYTNLVKINNVQCCICLRIVVRWLHRCGFMKSCELYSFNRVAACIVSYCGLVRLLLCCEYFCVSFLRTRFC